MKKPKLNLFGAVSFKSVSPKALRIPLFSKMSFLKYTLALASLTIIVNLVAQETSKEPIAYIGHGAMFDQKGKEVAPTLTFIQQAQAWYRAELLGKLTTGQRAQFSKFQRELTQDLVLDKQSRLVLNTYLLDWLLNTTKVENRDRIRGKNNLMKLLLQTRLSENPDIHIPRSPEPFNVNPKLLERLRLIPQKSGPQNQYGPVHYTSHTVTNAGGAAYRNLCQANGVPIPPDFGPASAWVSRGLIPQSELFIVAGSGAEVLTWESSSPVGMCIALPRFNTSSNIVSLDGVICMGKASSKVCFWDNEKNGTAFTFTRGASRPFTDWGGGSELVGAAGGVCTSCHAGENPYIIHPHTTALGGLSGLGLPTFPDSWHDPIVTSVDAQPWPENPGPMNAPMSCRGCHVQGSAGRFPHLSPALPGFCGTILPQAISRTMPPGAPGSLAGTPEMAALLNWCGIPATGDASSRGDPHVTTFDGVNYDFQGAGEFVFLRDANGLEIQTRHTPVATASRPGPNPHTGLASCVSVNTAVAARVGKHQISYQPEYPVNPERHSLELRIDRKLTTLPDQGIDLGDGGRVVKSAIGTGVEIYFPDKTHLMVVPNWWESQNTWYLNVDVVNTPGREGIMGAIAPGSWLPLLPDGASLGPIPASVHQRHIDLNQKFADAWRVTPATSLFDYAAGTSTLTYSNFGWPPEKGPCTIANSKIPPAKPMDPGRARELCSQIVEKNMKANCIFDVSVTGEAGFAKTYRISQQLRSR